MRFNCGPTFEQRRDAELVRIKAEVDRLQNWHTFVPWLPLSLGNTCVVFERVWRRFPEAFAGWQEGWPFVRRCAWAVEYRLVDAESGASDYKQSDTDSEGAS